MFQMMVYMENLKSILSISQPTAFKIWFTHLVWPWRTAAYGETGLMRASMGRPMPVWDMVAC